jgi:hypothetical protein
LNDKQNQDEQNQTREGDRLPENPLEGMNNERQEKQGIQSELEDQPSPDQANQDADEMAG